MRKLTVFFKQLQFRQVLTALLATVVLFVGTACNSGDIRGARPDNLPVQSGGANNPYKNGGDGNTKFNLSPDPKVSSKAPKSERDRADLTIISDRLIAAAAQDKLLYPGAEKPGNQPAIEQSLPKIGLQDFQQAERGGQIQRQSDVGDRVEDRLGTVKKALDKASEFIGQGANEGAQAGLKGEGSETGFRR